MRRRKRTESGVVSRPPLIQRVFEGYEGREFGLVVGVDVNSKGVIKIASVQPLKCPEGRKRMAAALVRRKLSEKGSELLWGHLEPEARTSYVFEVRMICREEDVEFKSWCSAVIEEV